MERIFVFGSELLQKDSLPIKILPELRKAFPKINFMEFDPTENMSELGRNPVIIDSAEGIKDVVILSDVDKIEPTKTFTLHGFDLGMNLKIMKKAGLLDSVRIICVPGLMGKEKAFSQVKKSIEILRMSI